MAALGLIMSAPAQALTPQQIEDQVVALQKVVAAQAATIATLQQQVTVISQNPALGLGPFLTINPNPELGVIGPNITFHGAKLLVV
jgi:hypothetical protein